MLQRIEATLHREQANRTTAEQDPFRGDASGAFALLWLFAKVSDAQPELNRVDPRIRRRHTRIGNMEVFQRQRQMVAAVGQRHMHPNPSLRCKVDAAGPSRNIVVRKQDAAAKLKKWS